MTSTNTPPLPRGPRAWFLIHPKGIVVRPDGDRIVLPTEEDIAALGVDAEGALDAGSVDGTSASLAAAVAEDVALPAPLEVRRLRDLYPFLGDATFAAAGRASQLVEWAATSRHCGRCGTPTERIANERCMRCPACGLLAYPRISPAIIVLVRRGDEALLARGARFPEAFFSTLAGFVEIGESLEQTLAREVREEVGVEVTRARYFGSQSWPFPHSLMLGFVAEWAGGEIHVDGEEIAEARWFQATDLPKVPPRISIARRLIDAWVGEVTAAREAGRGGAPDR